MAQDQRLIDSHEDRLQRLEDLAGETRNEVTRVAAEVGHVGNGVKSISQQITEGFQSLQAGMRDLERAQAKAQKEQAQALARIKKLEDEEKSRVKKQKKINGVVLGMLVSFLGVIAAKAGGWLWSALGRN